jgi:hypothetical protein
LSQLACRHHVTIALAQPGLRFPGDLAHRFRHGINGSELAARDAGNQAAGRARLRMSSHAASFTMTSA